VHTELGPADSLPANRRETEGVFVVSGRTVTFRPVRVGVAGAEHFEVLGGVRPGDTIVAGPYQAIRDLKDGAVVRAQKRAADSARD
jgi:HlyD family secretion protein